MRKLVDRSLLVYIQKQDGGLIFVDVVETTKNGRSYRIDGELWNRGVNLFCREICTNQHGEIWKIAPLRRDYIPHWLDNQNIEICERAKERYSLWLSKSYQG